MNFGMDIGWGSHLPMLIKIVGLTDGPVLELGTGLYSTPFLHWACFDSKRKLVSYEGDKDCYEINKAYTSDYHKVTLVKNWDAVDLSGYWSVALIDHHRQRRKIEARRLADSVDYLILHDSQGRLDRLYRYSQIYPLFKYRYDFAKVVPFTVVLSNFKDLSNL